MALGSSYAGSITAGTVHVGMHCMSLVYNYSDVGEFHVREHIQFKLHGSQMNKMQHNNEHWQHIYLRVKIYVGGSTFPGHWHHL